jgi:RNA recognition motif-containing protein
MKTYKVVYTSSNAGNMAYFKDLPSTTTTETIQEIGGKYGRIVDAYLQPSESGSLEAFIEYQFSDSVKKLVLSGPYNIDSTEIQPIRCRPLDSKWNFSNSEQKDTIYVSNLSIDCTKITLRELFSVHGKIKDIRLITTKNGYSFAYIQFQTAETAQGSLKSSGTKICGKPITVAISNPQKRKVHEIDEKELYISNLPKSITKEDILELFSGMDVDIRFPSIGFCFVSFKDVSQARKGLEFNGKIMDGKPIIVSVSDPNARKKKEEYKRFETGNATMFKPRVVVTAGVKTSVKKVHVDVKKVVAKSTVKDKGKEKGQEKSMTNADFRKMFLDSK